MAPGASTSSKGRASQSQLAAPTPLQPWRAGELSQRDPDNQFAAGPQAQTACQPPRGSNNRQHWPPGIDQQHGPRAWGVVRLEGLAGTLQQGGFALPWLLAQAQRVHPAPDASMPPGNTLSRLERR